VLYMDAATLADPAKNVRGGIPVLFPFAGKLAGGTFTLANTQTDQHGFGRNKPWVVVEQTRASVRMRLAPDKQTLAQWPYEFIADHHVMLVPGGVQCELTITAAREALPVSPGWHPYFYTSDKTAVRGDVALPSLGDEFDTGIPAPQSGRATFDVPGTGRLQLTFAPELRHLQLWSQPGKPFVCIEPFYGPANTINTEQRAWVPAEQARTYWMRIALAD
jgi:galactose mutarotase-like enzyme